MFSNRCCTSSLSSSRRRIAVIACALAAGLLVAPVAPHAQTPANVQPPTIVGSLTNFDVENETDDEEQEFEIQLEGLELNDITRVFGQTGNTCYIRYCRGTVEPFGVPGVAPFGVYVRWKANYDPATQRFTTPSNAPGGGSSGTPRATGVGAVTGDQCWSLGSGAAYANSGCEHFGVSTARNPTRTSYRWLKGDPATGAFGPATVTVGGVSVPAPPVAIPHPVADVVTPVDGVPFVQAVIRGMLPVDDNASLPHRYGKAQWVKVYKTELRRHANLDELVVGHPNNVVPNAQNVAAETEWKLLQFDALNPDSGGSLLKSGGATGSGSHSVLRRYEFYKYTGPVVAPGGTFRSKGGPKFSTDDKEASLCPREVPGDLTTDCISPGPDEVGDFIGAQMAAQNLNFSSTVTLGATIGAAGGSVTATVADGPGTPGDWVGLYDANGNCVQWQYLDGTQTLPATVATSATVTFTLPATLGAFRARLFNGSYTLVATSGPITSTAPIVTLESANLTAGGTATATIFNGPGSAGDWVGLYDANGNCVQWQYLDGTHTLPATGVTTASVTFTLPATTGAFRAQLYNRSYQLIATSETILTAGSSVALGAANGTAGGTTTATIVNGPGTSGDWVGLFDADGNCVQWQYLNGTHTIPAGGLRFATVTFTLPATPGTYHARLFNSTYTRVATSGTIATSAPSVTLTSSGTAGGAATATIANAPGTAGDWVGLFDANGNPVQWQYLNGSHSLPAAGVSSATITFILPATPGAYHARLFNAAYTRVATSGTITTSAPSVRLGAATGGTVAAIITNAPGTRGDWAGLYDASGNPVQWQYLNGSQSLPAAGVGAATLTFALPAPGIYQVRLFNGVYALMAVSETITVF